MTPENKAILKAQVEEWYKHPITQIVLDILKNHEIRSISAVTSASMAKDLDAEHCRRLAAQLSTVQTINKLLYAPGNIADRAAEDSSSSK